MWPSFYESEHLDTAPEKVLFTFFPLGIVSKATDVTLLHYNSFETGRKYYSCLFWNLVQEHLLCDYYGPGTMVGTEA